ncbi:MAG TPA: alpha/beta hydrolase [Chitinophagaceae bacterium]|nr:alpha/beta hydrolase [Chitinophagaceae bacterium]
MKNLSLLILCLIQLINLRAQSDLPFEEIIYGRKDGVALTMLQLKPTAKSNGKAVIKVIAGAWNSSYYQATGAIEDSKTLYTDKGFTVFEVIVGSQQRFAIDEQIEDVKRAVRYIRYNAKTLAVDPDHIGITGYSAGGHLSLAIATADERIDKTSEDPIDKVSSRVQAVAVLFPPVNFLDWDGNGFNLINVRDLHRQSKVFGAFDFRKWNDSTRTYDPVSDTAARNKIGKDISPFYSVSPDDPPVFIIHGDADNVVPLLQSESIIAKFKTAGVTNNFIIKKGIKHSVEDMYPEVKQFADWFDKYLK